MTTQRLGKFVAGPKMRVTDPCYSRVTWCVGTFRCKPGTWEAELETTDDTGGWGTRVKELRIRHVDHPKEPGEHFVGLVYEEDAATNLPSHPQKLGTHVDVGVDSGQAGFFCDEKYPNEPGDYEGPSFYHDVCQLTSDGIRGGVIEFGCVSSSGYGDGSYDCMVVRDGDDVVAATIVFIGDEEDEDEDEDEED